MEDKDWFWQDDSYRLDAESPLAISRSLWDGLAQSEADSLSLFAATPTPDIIESNHNFASSITDVDAGGKSLHHFHEPPREGSPRSKRRRMLLFPGSTTETSSIADPSFDSLLESTYESHLDAAFPGYEDYGRFEANVPISSNPLWYLKNDDPQFSIDEVLEPTSPKWLVRSFGDFESGSEPYDPTKVINVPKNELSAPCVDYQPRQTRESDVVDCPSTPYARCPTGKKPVSTEFVRTRTPTPVAYPFALLKPCGAQGDVTLSDINQRISMPPTRPKPPPSHQGGAAAAGGAGLSEATRRPSPSSSPAMSPGGSPGLSGKSVVALTKIHTEGNGSITIMRTRG